MTGRKREFTSNEFFEFTAECMRQFVGLPPDS